MNNLFITAAIANIAPLALCCLYSGGAPLLFMLFPPVHILLFLLNNKAARTWRQIISLGMLHIVITIATHQLFGHLYFSHFTDDVVGHAISLLGGLVGLAITLILFIVSLVMFRRR